jgi:hypothetical protein
MQMGMEMLVAMETRMEGKFMALCIVSSVLLIKNCLTNYGIQFVHLISFFYIKLASLHWTPPENSMFLFKYARENVSFLLENLTPIHFDFWKQTSVK